MNEYDNYAVIYEITIPKEMRTVWEYDEVEAGVDVVESYGVYRVSKFIASVFDETEAGIGVKRVFPVNYSYRKGLQLYVEYLSTGKMPIWYNDILRLALFADFIQDLDAPEIEKVIKRLADMIISSSYSPAGHKHLRPTPGIVSSIQRICDIEILIRAVKLGRIHSGWIHTLDLSISNDHPVRDIFGKYKPLNGRHGRHGRQDDDVRVSEYWNSIDLFKSVTSLTTPYMQAINNIPEGTLDNLVIVDKYTHINPSISRTLLAKLETFTSYNTLAYVKRGPIPMPSEYRLKKVVASGDIISEIFIRDSNIISELFIHESILRDNEAERERERELERSYPTVEILEYLNARYVPHLTVYLGPYRFPNLHTLTIHMPIMSSSLDFLDNWIDSSLRSLNITLKSDNATEQFVLGLFYVKPITAHDIESLRLLPTSDRRPMPELHSLGLIGVKSNQIEMYCSIAPYINVFGTDVTELPIDFKFPRKLHGLSINPKLLDAERCLYMNMLDTLEFVGKIDSNVIIGDEFIFSKTVKIIRNNTTVGREGGIMLKGFSKLTNVIGSGDNARIILFGPTYLPVHGDCIDRRRTSECE